MNMRSILDNKITMNQQLRQKVDEDCSSMRIMIENLVECATNLNGQGLSAFLSARDDTLKELERIRIDYQVLLCECA